MTKTKIRIYTDGACSNNPGPGGWGAIILLPEGKEEVSGYEEETTNNRMELKAVISALKVALMLDYKRIDVYSDSAYVVNAVKQKWIRKWEFNGWKTTSKQDVKNRDLWETLSKLLKKHKRINLIKVKGHSGNKYNERADVLAKRAIERGLEGA